MMSTNLSDSQLEEFWNNFDVNGDGHLNKEEFAKMQAGMMKIMTCEMQITSLWAMFDKDRNGTLDASEFEKMCDELELGTEGKYNLVRSIVFLAELKKLTVFRWRLSSQWNLMEKSVSVVQLFMFDRTLTW